jgi:hypothetical protein
MFGGADRLLNPMAAPRFYFHSANLRAHTLRPAYVAARLSGQRF